VAGLRSELELKDVEAYLNSRLDAPTKLTSVTQTFPGMSRETWIALAEDPKEVGYVVRIDPASGGSVPIPLKLEWDVYVRLWPSPIPTAEPLWFDEGIDFAGGQPHMVRRMVDGTTHLPGFLAGPEGDAAKRATAFEHAEKLALLHTLDWKQYGLDEVLDAPASPIESLRHQMSVWRGYWDKVRVTPMPLVTEALYWFDEQMPPPGDRVALLKGNNGLGEEIWKDGRIVAMSDWELAELGEPALDWAFSQGMLKLHDEGETLRHYEEHAGFAIDPARLAWSRLWLLFKVMVCSSCAIPSYEARRDRRPGLATLGLMVGRIEQMLGLVITKDLDEAAALLGGVLG
jgi:aminoglycoside phosphotransferase (APT) family kinase protein